MYPKPLTQNPLSPTVGMHGRGRRVAPGERGIEGPAPAEFGACYEVLELRVQGSGGVVKVKTSGAFLVLVFRVQGPGAKQFKSCCFYAGALTQS